MRRKLSVLDVATTVVLLVAAALLLRPDSILVSGVRSRVDRWSQDRAVVANWDSLVALSMPLYAGDGPPDVLEFSDYECPFCRAISPSVDSALAAGVKVGIVHLPLPNHRNARVAAKTAICAGGAADFNRVHKKLYESIAWFGDSTMSDSISTLLNILPVKNCASETPTAVVLDQHVALAERLKINATPTFVTRRGVVRDRLSAATLLSHGQAQ